MAVELFFCYAHEDEAELIKLKTHLSPFQRQGLINVWHDRDINAGAEWAPEILNHLNAAQMILLLVSPDFINSDYCYDVEMKQAMERHERGEALVIPIILRPVHWHETPFGKLQALPRDGKFVIGSFWNYVDEAFFDIAEGVRKAVIEWPNKPQQKQNASNKTLKSDKPLDRIAPINSLLGPSTNGLSGLQKLFLTTFLLHAGEQAIGEKFTFTGYKGVRHLQWNRIKIDVSLSDEDLLDLARLGYLQIYTNPRSIVFTKLTLEMPTTPG